MHSLVRTAEFDAWLRKLGDRVAVKQIAARLDRLAFGHRGDAKSVGDDVIELRIHSGPGYRVYCWQDGPIIVVLLTGGDKGTQQRDVARAKAMVKTLKEHP